MIQQRREERSLGELFGELSRETSTLIRQEMELAKTEMSDKAARVGKDIGFLAIGGAVAYAGFLALLAAVIALLAVKLPVWLSAFVVGAIVTGIGYYLVQKGRTALKHEDLTPHRTLASLKEDQEWAKEQIS